MKKRFFTFFIALVTGVGTMFAENVQIGDLYYNLDATNQTAEVFATSMTNGLIQVDDNSIADWNTLPAQYVVQATCPADAVMTGLKSVKVYADAKYINILVEPNMEDLPDLSYVPFDIFLNTDNSDATGGYGDLFTDANTDILLEGALFSDNNPCAYAPAVYKWWGEVGSTGWWWTDPNVSHDSSDCWGAIVCEGQLRCNSQYVNGKFEIQIDRSYIPATWNNTAFGIGFDILQNWDWAGFLPCVSPYNDGPNGRTSKLQVTIDNTPYIIPNTEIIGNVVIPETVSDGGVTYTVTSIRNFAFSGCTGLTSITIPTGVTSIGNNAFGGCDNLTSVVWNARNCGAYNFGGQITSFTFGNDVEVIPASICSGMSQLTSIIIPSNVTNIGTWAFDGCSGLKSVTIPNSVTSIGEGAFNGCSSLIKVNIADIAAWCNITFSNESSNPLWWNTAHLCVNDVTITNMVIPNSVTSIKNNAFCGCSSLISVTIPNSVTSIGEQAFCLCANLTSITIPNSVKNIGFFAFNSCVSLTSVTIPNSVTSIEYCAFYLCTRLKSVTIPNSVASIGYGAFYGCGSLTSVTIPNSVISIGGNAFSYCGSLTLIYNYANSPQVIDSSVFWEEGEWDVDGIKLRPVDKGTCKLYVPGESLALYKTANVWKEFSNILPIPQTEGVENVATISTNAQSTKVVRDGQVLIQKGDKTYTLTGAEVK